MSKLKISALSVATIAINLVSKSCTDANRFYAPSIGSNQFLMHNDANRIRLMQIDAIEDVPP